MTRRITITLLAIVALSAASPTGDASSIDGQITDHKGAPVAAADVRLRNLMTQETEHVAADEKGSYRFHNLPQGRYSLVVEHSGYSAIWIRQFVVNSGEKSTRNVTLTQAAKRGASR
jgi:Carboxypeptidase regulatory-like domain